MRRQEFDNYIAENNFTDLFNSMGWNNPDSLAPVIAIVDENKYTLECVAQRNGFKVYVCKVDVIPPMTIIKTIDKRLRKSSNDYILIFIAEQMHHEWVVPVKTIDKRIIVPVEYTTTAQLDFLYSKHTDLSFDIEEESTILDVTKKVHSAFELNSEKITKDFYIGFRKQHNSFADFISGIPVESDKQWYVSVMLNRLMFCYFIQKKNFLDFNPNYLREKLEECKQKEGNDKFFKSFYKSFLVQLFQGGLNTPNHENADFKEKFGRIPYLNGGMFDQHQIEKQYADIDIADEAFENLFDFFDKYKWHLDTRIEASGKDINPDVLGYIFEQYINDRAQMGAYYTREDITNYIGKNCILPFLVTDAIKRFGKDVSFIWTFLKESGDKYIYDSIKKGVELPLPENIAVGVDVQIPNLLERRKEWNTQTSIEYGLPTEIWRETVERRQKYEETKHKIKKGEIKEINDFITYNLDIMSFVQDLLSCIDDVDFIKCFYESLLNVSVLDPTCGSGAFLFAALNILEPLYEICIDRLDSIKKEIKDKYRSNIQYFIYKNIILRNLYGVDIMTEATEIAKLRLFLKMVAVVEANKRLPNLGLDPLPDIDFNIRSGNSLVGYATEQEVLKSFTDLFEKADWETKIKNKVKEISTTYTVFKECQLKQTDSMKNFKSAKHNLQASLADLNEMLNKRMYNGRTNISYEDWLKNTQPFHWFAEFYEIIAVHGGFDVIIGNPPYVEYSKVKEYKIFSYKTERCSNLYCFTIERSINFLEQSGKLSMIVPISLTGNKKMEQTIKLLKNNTLWISFYSGDTHPGTLFNGVQQNLSIFIYDKSRPKKLYTTDFIRFNDSTDERYYLFTSKVYYNQNSLEDSFVLKIGSEKKMTIFNKFLNNNSLERLAIMDELGTSFIYYHDVVHYWVKAFSEAPYFKREGEEPSVSSHYKRFHCQVEMKPIMTATLSSSFFYMWYISKSNCRDFSKDDLINFKFLSSLSENIGNLEAIKDISNKFIEDLNKNKVRVKYSKASGDVEYDQFWVTKSKPIIDKIDTLLAKQYGFTEEELDYIINYDIKYRMGNELEEE